MICIVCYITVVGFANSTPAQGALNLWLGLFLVGFCGGILVTIVLSLLVFPKSATGMTISEIRKALQAASDLHSATWEVLEQSEWMKSPTSQSLLRPPAASITGSPIDGEEQPPSHGRQTAELGEDRTASQRVEDAVSAFVMACQTAEDCMVIAENELFSGQICTLI